MILAAYLVAGFMVASIYAVGWLKGRRDRYHQLGFLIPFTVAAIALPIQFFVGDTAARAIASDQPAKFASMEYILETGAEPDRVGRRRAASATRSSSAIPIPGPGLDPRGLLRLDTVVTGSTRSPRTTGRRRRPCSTLPST